VTLGKKLNLKDGMTLRILVRPRDVDLEDVVPAKGPIADGVVLFARTLADVDEEAGPVLEAARAGRLAWIAYPKAGQLGTDLSRDLLARHLAPRKVRPVRMIAVDGVWSAMRFRAGT
jgi:protein involved in temperature-dependent protein secretion